VDFGASDTGMKKEEIAKVERGVVLLPMTAVVMAQPARCTKASSYRVRVYTDIFGQNQELE